MVTDVSGTEDHLHQKYQIQDYQNKDRLSVYFYYSEKYTLLQRVSFLLLLQWTAQRPACGHTGTKADCAFINSFAK